MLKIILLLSLEIANIFFMKTISEEIRLFLEVTGISQAGLSAASGVPASTICNLLKGKRKNLLGPNQDAIRAAMRALRANQSSVSYLRDPVVRHALPNDLP